MKTLEAPPIDAVLAAADRIADLAIRTPLVGLNVAGTPARIHLKLENLQPIGSFKVRGAGNAIRCAHEVDLDLTQGPEERGNSTPRSRLDSRTLPPRRWRPCSVVRIARFDVPRTRDDSRDSRSDV